MCQLIDKIILVDLSGTHERFILNPTAKLLDILRDQPLFEHPPSALMPHAGARSVGATEVGLVERNVAGSQSVQAGLRALPEYPAKQKAKINIGNQSSTVSGRRLASLLALEPIAATKARRRTN